MTQTEYLHLMQIETWNRQQQVHADARNLSAAYVYFLGANGALLASADLETQDEFNLANQIVKALKLPFQGGLHSKFEVSSIGSSVTVFVCLGQGIAANLFPELTDLHRLYKLDSAESKQVIVTHSLQAMLEDNSLKRQTWTDLQCAMRVINATHDA